MTCIYREWKQRKTEIVIIFFYVIYFPFMRVIEENVAYHGIGFKIASKDTKMPLNAQNNKTITFNQKKPSL